MLWLRAHRSKSIYILQEEFAPCVGRFVGFSTEKLFPLIALILKVVVAFVPEKK